MRKGIFNLIVIFSLMGFIQKNVLAQNGTLEWDLNRCISYALDNSIQVKKMQLEVSSSQVDLLKSKSAWMPTLNASASENLSNSLSSGNTNFSLSSSMPLYQGGAILNGIKKSKLGLEQANLNVEATQKSITLSIVQAYLNILYAKESADYYKEVVGTSEKQVYRANERQKAGSIAKKDLAQMEAQLSSDNYSLVVAKNNIISNTTALKQLLEISVTDTFIVAFPEIGINDSLIVLPTMQEVIKTALSIMPEVKSSLISTSIAETELKIAKASYYPSLNLSAGYSTNYASNSGGSFSSQLSENDVKSIGVSLSIPIFNRNTTRASVQQSKISVEQAKLSYRETEKNLVQEVENVYQDAVAAISRYKSAKEQMASADESYRLSEQQFNIGMLNIVELLDVKNSLLNAKSELSQSKYSAILNLKILDFYMGKQISL